MPTVDPGYTSRKFRSLERVNSISAANGFDPCDSCKRLGTSRLHELHESKLLFVGRTEFIRSKLSIFSAHVSVVFTRREGAGGGFQWGAAVLHCYRLLNGSLRYFGGLTKAMTSH